MQNEKASPKGRGFSFCCWYAPSGWKPSYDANILEPGLKPDSSDPDIRGPERPALPPKRRMRKASSTSAPYLRFDVHPDGKRIALEGLELREADIGMIEETR
jgi:hypothetical protein